jgi:hypothetical protein
MMLYSEQDAEFVDGPNIELTTDETRSYSYDAENRLVEVVPASLSSGRGHHSAATARALGLPGPMDSLPPPPRAAVGQRAGVGHPGGPKLLRVGTGAQSAEHLETYPLEHVALGTDRLALAQQDLRTLRRLSGHRGSLDLHATRQRRAVEAQSDGQIPFVGESRQRDLDAGDRLAVHAPPHFSERQTLVALLESHHIPFYAGGHSRTLLIFRQ